MSASTLKSVKPRGRLQRFITLDRLATAITWAFWVITIFTVLQVIVALTRSGSLFGPNSQPGSPPRVWVTIAPPRLQHAGSLLIHSGLAAGVQASWLRVGTLYLAMRLARTAARDGVYTTQAARLVLFLGWWLLAGGLMASLAAGFARLTLLGLLVTWHVDWVHWPATWAYRSRSNASDWV